MPGSHLVIGGNRGIGLALVEELTKQHPSDTVFATTRDPSNSKELDDVVKTAGGSIKILQLDMLNETSVKTAVESLSAQTKSLDSVIINAAILVGQGPLQNLSAADLLQNLEGNVVGPHSIFKYFSPFLLASTASNRRMIVISSIGGSITSAKDTGTWLKNAVGIDFIPLGGYVISKSGVNMLARQWADILEPEGVSVICVHPGGVATRMTEGMAGTISPAESAQGVVDAISKVNIEDTGKGMYSYDGSLLPW